LKSAQTNRLALSRVCIFQSATPQTYEISIGRSLLKILQFASLLRAVKD
jgi:hypothetical protein